MNLKKIATLSVFALALSVIPTAAYAGSKNSGKQNCTHNGKTGGTSGTGTTSTNTNNTNSPSTSTSNSGSTSGSTSTSTSTSGSSSNSGSSSKSGVNNSGNSSATGGNGGNGGAGGKGGNAQGGNAQGGSSSSSADGGSAANNSAGNTTAVSSSYNEVRQTPMAYAPDAIPTAPCVKSYGAGASGPMFGASFGGGKIDKGCDTRETAREFALMHNFTAAAKLLCSTDAAKRAKLTIDDCLAMVPEPAPVAPTVTPIVVTPVAPVLVNPVVTTPTPTPMFTSPAVVNEPLTVPTETKKIAQ